MIGYKKNINFAPLHLLFLSFKEKPHKCEVCNKTFPTPGDLKSHRFVHSGVWPFRCHICNRGFTKQNIARNHMLGHIAGRVKKNVTLSVWRYSKSSSKIQAKIGGRVHISIRIFFYFLISPDSSWNIFVLYFSGYF